MRINSRRKGYVNERVVGRILESFGYYMVKSAMSLGYFDLVAISKNSVRLIQCKPYSDKISQEEEEFKLIPCPSNVFKEWWSYQRGGLWIIRRYDGSGKLVRVANVYRDRKLKKDVEVVKENYQVT